MRVLRVRRICGDRQHVEVADRALRRNRVGEIDAFARFLRPIVRLLHVPRPAQRETDLAVGEVVDVARRVDITDERADRHQDLLRSLEILGTLAVGILAEVQQHGPDHFRRGVQNRHAAVLEFRKHRRIEEQAPVVDRRVRHALLDLGDVVARPRGDPHEVDGVLIARVIQSFCLGDFRIQALEIRQ